MDFTDVIVRESLPIMHMFNRRENAQSAKADELLLEAELKYIGGFHALVILIAIFGASVTFPLILTPISNPANPSNLATVRTLLAVSWSLFVVGALFACAAAGNFYSRGYLKAVTEAREAVENARRTAQRLVAPETRDVPVPTTGTDPIVPPQLAQLEEIMSAARRGASRSINPGLIETLRAAESEQVGIQHEMQRSIEENLAVHALDVASQKSGEVGFQAIHRS